MKNVFTVDGVAYNVTVKKLKRKFSVQDTDKSGRVIAKGEMIRDVIGTFYNYTIEIETKNLDMATYDRLYEVLSSPADYHVITVPYGQGTRTFRAYVTSGDDEIRSIDASGNHWTGLSINFIRMEAARIA